MHERLLSRIRREIGTGTLLPRQRRSVEVISVAGGYRGLHECCLVSDVPHGSEAHSLTPTVMACAARRAVRIRLHALTLSNGLTCKPTRLLLRHKSIVARLRLESYLAKSGSER